MQQNTYVYIYIYIYIYRIYMLYSIYIYVYIYLIFNICIHIIYIYIYMYVYIYIYNTIHICTYVYVKHYSIWNWRKYHWRKFINVNLSIHTLKRDTFGKRLNCPRNLIDIITVEKYDAHVWIAADCKTRKLRSCKSLF